MNRTACGMSRAREEAFLSNGLSPDSMLLALSHTLGASVWMVFRAFCRPYPLGRRAVRLKVRTSGEARRDRADATFIGLCGVR